MKKELIKTENYLLVVDDSEITNNDWFIPIGGFGWEINKPKQASKLDGYHNEHCRKLIAHLPLNDSPILEGVPLLPPLEVDDDIEKLNEDLFDKGSDNVLHPQYQMRIFFNMGYNKAREKYKYTEEDMKNVIECTLELTKTSNGLQ